MKNKYFIVVDMQNDFCTGSLKNDEAVKIIPDIVAKIKELKAKGYRIIATRDTHHSNYLKTKEGRNLPVEHCIENSNGWQVVNEISPLIDKFIDKGNFCYLKWGEVLKDPEVVELCGVVTSICVASNAICISATFPETEVIVHSALTADITKENYNSALNTMRAQQITIV